ncbi:GntR family transcriptional regulator, partial [Pseudomonas aeruginosa]
LDIANRIYDGEFKEGEKIYGRSTLAGEYNVSPETIRKSIKILEDVQIVRSEKGSGVIISSRENALKFIRRFSDIKSLKELEQEARSLINERAALDKKLTDTITKILHYSGALRNTN